MSVGKAIFSILSNDATLVTDLGGSSKVYPLRAPQETAFPYIVYNRISTQPNDTKDGVSTLDVVRVQFDFYGENYDDLITIEERTRTLIDKYRGTVAGVNVDSVIYLTENDTWEPDDDIYRISCDYNFRIQRTATISGGSGVFEGLSQKFTNVSGSTLTVTAGNLPIANFDTDLEVYRDGILLFHNINYTVSGNVITPSIPFIGENFLIKFKPS